ncbi:MAG: TetR/AcrR family transcriptional regulator [Anaerolineae bacterium]|nr:TetR/AcrR family transcriptional regulator [Anaerolineae bacterium]
MPRLSTAVRDDVLTETRQQLLAAAAVEFADKGFASANINHISTAAGFAKGTIYNYFSSKRALMLALIDEIAATHTNFIMAQVETAPNPTQRLQRFFSAGFTFVEQHSVQARLAINVVYGHDDEFKQRIYQAYQPLFTLLIEGIVGDGITQGDFKHVDPNLTAALLMSIYLGSCSLLDSVGKIWFDPDQIVIFVMEGLRQPNGRYEDQE